MPHPNICKYIIFGCSLEHGLAVEAFFLKLGFPGVVLVPGHVVVGVAVSLRLAQPELARGVSKGVLHKNTVARKMSRLSSRVKGIVAPEA